MEEFAKEKGFSNERERFSLISSVDLSTPDKIDKYKHWRHNDGTKAGLLTLINREPVVINIKTSKDIIRGIEIDVPFEMLTYGVIKQMATSVNEFIGDDLDFRVEGWCIADPAGESKDLLF